MKFFLLENSMERSKFALIPWDYFPPHKGHYAFIKHYADLVGSNGKVVIFIDQQTHAKETSEILKKYVSNLPNVITSFATNGPAQSCLDFSQEALNVDTNPVIVLASPKDKKHVSLTKKIQAAYKKKAPECFVIDPTTTTCSDIETVSMKKFIAAMGDEKQVVQFLPDHLSTSDKLFVADVLKHCSHQQSLD